MAIKYKHIAVGGTFDLLHAGHEKLLKTAFSKSQFVTIGISTDKFAKSSGKIPFENQAIRIKNLKLFLGQNKLTKKSKIIWLNDIWGITLKDKTLQGLVITKQTQKNADLINNLRVKKKLKKLALIICPLANSQDQNPISSTQIKSGVIDRNGKIYIKALAKIFDKPISVKARDQLKKPFGKLVRIDKKTASFYPPFITVGDITTSTFLKSGIIPNISIVDFKVQRKPRFTNLTNLGFATNNPDVIVTSNAGIVSENLVISLAKMITQNQNRGQVILVYGEEDLAAIPAVLLSPLGTNIYYGQPNKGAVLINVTQKAKEALCNLLKI